MEKITSSQVYKYFWETFDNCVENGINQNNQLIAEVSNITAEKFATVFNQFKWTEVIEHFIKDGYNKEVKIFANEVLSVLQKYEEKHYNHLLKNSIDQNYFNIIENDPQIKYLQESIEQLENFVYSNNYCSNKR